MTFVRAPGVSVIVTNYNYAPYLEDCLDSIARQTLTNFRCVIVDDASTDGSEEKIDRFIDSDRAAGRFEKRVHKRNAGQMVGFKTGLAASDGEFVVFVDADDLLAADFLEVHLRAHLNTHHSVAFTCSDQAQINAAGEVVSASFPTLLKEQRDPTRVHRLTDPSPWVMAENHTLDLQQREKQPVFVPPITADTGVWRWSATSAMMFRRATLDLILCEDCDQFRLYADYYLCMFAHVIGGSVIIPTVHGCYRRHGNNAFSSSQIIGSDHAVHDLRADIPLAIFHHTIVSHLIRNFGVFRGVIDENQLYMIVARFASPALLQALGDENSLSRIRLLKCRVTWRVAGIIVWLRSRLFWLRRIVAS